MKRVIVFIAFPMLIGCGNIAPSPSDSNHIEVDSIEGIVEDSLVYDDSVAEDYYEYAAEPEVSNQSGNIYGEEVDNYYDDVRVTTTETPNIYGSPSTQSENTIGNNYFNYEETDYCEEGVVVYEGDNDYFIIETRKGYTIAERRHGRLSEGNRVRGELNSYGNKYIINKRTDSETKIYIEDYRLSKDAAIEWMGEHERLKLEDQEAYEQVN